MTVVVDTAQSAEFDILLHGIEPAVVNTIAEALRRLPQAQFDKAVGPFLLRQVEGFDIVWMIGREDRDVVISICRIRPPDPANPTELLLQSLEFVGKLRGATGI